MYKALIVDDESIIRTGIQRVIPWVELGITETFTACSGMEALQIIGREQPHILITDINMTEMTGLEMIERVHDIQPEIKIIVITGYDSFEYVHKCIKMHVDDFFLKPVDEDELGTAVRKLVEQLEDERQEQLLRRTQGSSEQLFLEQSLRDLIHNRYDQSNLPEVLARYHLDANESMRVALLIPVLGGEQDSFHTLLAKNLSVDLIDRQEAGLTLQDDDGTVVIAAYSSADPVERITQLSHIIRDELGANPKTLLGKEIVGFSNLHLSYDDAAQLLKTDGPEIIQSGQGESRLQAFQMAFTDIRHTMASNIDSLDTVLEAFSTFEQAVSHYNLSDAMVRKYCFEAVSAVCYSYAVQSGSFTEGKLQSLLVALQEAGRQEALDDTRNVLSQILSVPDENLHDIVSRVKAIVQENLDQGISVLSIANQLYISPNYLSRLFKKVSGEGCSEYIVRKRIEKAKSLLEATNLQSGKIASMVGYQDINYFSIAFKKHTGMSPTKYREEKRRQVAAK